MLITSACRRLRLEDQEFEASLGYTTKCILFAVFAYVFFKMGFLCIALTLLELTGLCLLSAGRRAPPLPSTESVLLTPF